MIYLRIVGFILFVAATLNCASLNAEPAKIDSVLIEADRLFYNGDFDKCIELADSRIAYLTSIQDTQNLITAFNLRASGNLSLGQIDNAEEFYNRALKIAFEYGDTLRIATGYENISTVFTSQGRYDAEKAISYLLESSKLKEDANLKYYLPTTYKKLSSIFQKIGNKEKCKVYLMKALELVNEGYYMKGFDAAIFNEVGRFYTDEELNYDSALFYFNKTLKISKKMGWKRGISVSIKNIASVYEEMGDYVAAIEGYKKSLELNIEMGHAAGIVNSYYVIGKNYAKVGDQIKAIVTYKKGIAKANEFGIISDLPNLYKSLYESFKSIKNITEALSAYENYVFFNDSILGIEQKKQITELETKYESEKKEQQIINLTQEKELQEIRTRQQKLWVFSLIILVCIITLMALLFIRQNKIKAKERETQIQQQLFRSQMNPHFFFNALGSIQNFIHYNQPDDATSYLSKFAKLMRNILESSTSEFIEIDKEIEIVNNYLSLQKLRHNNNINFKINTNLGDDEIVVPPMLAQPFIENSIVHGLKNVEREGIVEVNYSINNNDLVLEIIDNGIGIDSSKINQSSHKSYAISLTKQRLKLLHKKCKIEIIDRKNKNEQGTKVEIVIPKDICLKF